MKLTPITSVAVALTSLILLSGCSQSVAKATGEITLKEAYNVSSMPNWDENSTTVLSKEGWTVTPLTTIFPMKDGNKEPASFSAMNKQGNCSINYIIAATAPSEATVDSDYIFTQKSVELIIGDPINTVSDVNTKSYITVDKDVKLQMLSIQYSQLVASVKQNTVMLTRVISSPISNPFAPELFDTETVNPSINLTYTCTGADLDMKLWEKVVSSANISY